jgi:hypothetical protein
MNKIKKIDGKFYELVPVIAPILKVGMKIREVNMHRDAKLMVVRIAYLHREKETIYALVDERDGTNWVSYVCSSLEELAYRMFVNKVINPFEFEIVE